MRIRDLLRLGVTIRPFPTGPPTAIRYLRQMETSCRVYQETNEAR